MRSYIALRLTLCPYLLWHYNSAIMQVSILLSRRSRLNFPVKFQRCYWDIIRYMHYYAVLLYFRCYLLTDCVLLFSHNLMNARLHKARIVGGLSLTAAAAAVVNLASFSPLSEHQQSTRPPSTHARSRLFALSCFPSFSIVIASPSVLKTISFFHTLLRKVSQLPFPYIY